MSLHFGFTRSLVIGTFLLACIGTACSSSTGSIDDLDNQYQVVSFCGRITNLPAQPIGLPVTFQIILTDQNGVPGTLTGKTTLDQSGLGCISQNIVDSFGFFTHIVPRKSKLLSLTVTVPNVSASGKLVDHKFYPAGNGAGTIFAQAVFDFNNPKVDDPGALSKYILKRILSDGKKAPVNKQAVLEDTREAKPGKALGEKPVQKDDASIQTAV